MSKMDNFPRLRVEIRPEVRAILEKISRVAVHGSDLDGIASAAILLLLKPSLKIDFLTVSEALNPHASYDLVVDLPKIGNAINIDHHKTNYEKLISEGRLNKEDLVDPNAPSAAMLVAKYFGIDTDPYVMKIVDMANRADLGQFDDKIYTIDKVIKCNSRDKESMYKIATAIAMYADNFDKDEWLQKEIDRIRGVFAICKRMAEEITDYVLKRCGIYYLIFQVVSGVPRICVGDIMHRYIEEGGKVIVLINTMEGQDKYCPSLTSNMSNRFFRVSIRSSDPNFDARKILEMFGGGGHKVAAGARIQRGLLAEFITMMLRELSSIGRFVMFLKVTEELLESWGR